MKLVLILHDVRSAHNVGSLLRTADGLGVSKVYLTGITPYPLKNNDTRLPHVAKRADSQIAKTALGAENTVRWNHENDIGQLLAKLKELGYLIVALEQTNRSIALSQFRHTGDVALIVGSERGGLPTDIIAAANQVVEIPMKGRKESFNVAVAAAIAIYHLQHFT